MRRLVAAALLLPILSTPIPARSLSTDARLTLFGEAGRLTVAGYEVDVSQVRFPEDGGVVLSGAMLTRPGRDGHILLRQVETPDLDLLAHILAPATTCDPLEASGGTILVRDVRFSPDTDMGVEGGKEDIRLPLMTIETSRIGCSWRMTLLSDGVVISGIDGSRLDISAIEARIRMSGEMFERLEARVDFFGISLSGVQGLGGLDVDEMGFAVSADVSEGGLIHAFLSGAPIPEIIATANKDVTRGGFYMRGIDMIPGLFLPQRDLERLNLTAETPISGDMEASISAERGDLRFRASSDLSGLVRGSLDLTGSLPGPDGFKVPEVISKAIPVPADLIGFSVAGASVYYEDLGVGLVIRNLTGASIRDIFSERIEGKIERISSRLPAGLPATLDAGGRALTQILENGRGAAGFRPDKPFSLLDLAMSGMMGPGIAGSRTGAWLND